jgi:hypothetical protein
LQVTPTFIKLEVSLPLSQIHPLATTDLFVIHFNIILPYMYEFPRWNLSFTFSGYNIVKLVCTSRLELSAVKAGHSDRRRALNRTQSSCVTCKATATSTTSPNCGNTTNVPLCVIIQPDTAPRQFVSTGYTSCNTTP